MSALAETPAGAPRLATSRASWESKSQTLNLSPKATGFRGFSPL